MTKKYRILALLLFFAALCLCGCSEKQTTEVGVELLKNGDFAVIGSDGLPADWTADAYVIEKTYTDYELIEEDGAHVLHISNLFANDARMMQEVSVDPGSYYLLHGYIKADAQGGLGANLSIGDIYAFSDCVYNTDGEWVEITYYGKTDSERDHVKVFARLGGYGGEATGEAWFKEISLTKVDQVPTGYSVESWYTQSQANSNAGVTSETEGGTAASGIRAILLAAAAYIILAEVLLLFVRKERFEKSEISKKQGIICLALILALAAAIRVVIAVLVPGYDVDISCFTSWTATMQSSLPWGFYANSGFCDYPPGYMLVLWLFSLGMTPTAFLVKLPSIVFDILLALLIYAEGRKHVKTRYALAMACLYAFNPMTILTGAAWGQSDAVMTGLLVLCVILVLRNEWKYALPIYTLSVLMKPQALMFGPVGLIAFIMTAIPACRRKMNCEKNGKQMLIDSLIGFGASFALLIVVSLLFKGNQGLFWLAELYGKTMGSYAYTTVNACNSYFLAGLNWTETAGEMRLSTYLMIFMIYAVPSAMILIGKLRAYLKNRETPAVSASLMKATVVFGIMICAVAVAGVLMKAFGVLTYANFSTFMIIANVLLAGSMLFGSFDMKNLPLCGAVLLVLLFNTGSMMHERYLFPVLGLLCIAYLVKKDKRLIALMIGITVAGFLNVGCVLDRNIRIGGVSGHLSAPLFGINSDMAPLEYISAALNYLLSMVTLYVAMDIMVFGRTDMDFETIRKTAGISRFEGADPDTAAEQISRGTFEHLLLKKPEKKTSRMTAKDLLIMGVVTVAYSVMAFTNLGSLKAPETYYKTTAANEAIVFDLGSEQDFKIMYYCGIQNIDAYDFSVMVSEDGENWGTAFSAVAEDGDCFRWKYVANGIVQHGRYVKLDTGYLPGLWLNEILCRTADGDEPIPMTVISGPAEANALCDEPGTLEGEPEDWWNSTYFDEIYHARTAYEHLHSMTPYETTHPPLGKVIMSWGVAIFGMCPFGWRFMGTLSGVLMLPAIYMLGRLLFKKRRYAAGALLMLALDEMHFTQTRIATIDTFVVMFILWSLYFMVYWVKQDWFGTKLWRTLVPLGMSGFFMGCSIASKMTGCYNGLALALIFFVTLFCRMRQAAKAKKLLVYDTKKKKSREDEAAAPLIPEERRYAVQTAAKEAGKRHIITLLSCIGFFIVIPALVYYCSYIPYFAYAHGGVTIQRVIDAFNAMLSYHSQPGFGMDHYFYSPWYEWPLCLRPMWYYQDAHPAAGYDSTIMAMGNPVVWLGGLLGMIACVLLSLRDYYRRTRALYDQGKCRYTSHVPQLLIVMFAAQYLPWILVPRGTYIYHYFACVPIICLALMAVLEWLEKELRLYKKAKPAPDAVTAAPAKARHIRIDPVMIILILYLGLVLAGFIAYFPYASGITVSERWLDAVKILDNWLWH